MARVSRPTSDVGTVVPGRCVIFTCCCMHSTFFRPFRASSFLLQHTPQRARILREAAFTLEMTKIRTTTFQTQPGCRLLRRARGK